MEPPLRVTVRDRDLAEVSPLGPYSSLEIDARLMADGGQVGQLTAEIPNTAACLPYLLAEGSGVVVRQPSNGRVVWSGWTVDPQTSLGPGGTCTVIAEADDSLARDEIAYAVPGTDVPSASSSAAWSATTWDTRTGYPDAVILAYIAANIGPAADVTRRRYPWLTIPAAANLGTSGTWKARAEPLMDLIRRIALPAGLAVRFVHAGPGEIEVRVWQPAAAASARFSVDAGDVTGLQVTGPRAPSTDEVIVLGSGSGTARVMTRRSDTAAQALWGRRRVKVISASTTDLTQMREPADEQLAADAGTQAVAFTLAPSSSRRVGEHLDLGDVARVWTGEDTGLVTDVVRQWRLTHQEGSAPAVTVQVGSTQTDTSDRAKAAITRLTTQP